MIKLFYWDNNNFGDIIGPHIVSHFWNDDIKKAKADETGKLLSVGSIIARIKRNDKVWGSGLLRDKEIDAPSGVQFIAVRGPLTKKRVNGCDTDVFGDLGLLLPEIYNPEVKKTGDLGIVPHFVDDRFKGRENTIDVTQDWKSFIEELKSYKIIASSSLHGIVTAEAYGIPAIWIDRHKDMKGSDFKFQDYFLGTGRNYQESVSIEDIEFSSPVDEIEDLEKIQTRLVEAAKKYMKDVVYVYKADSRDHTTIDYSVRSIRENLPHKNIFIIGDDPCILDTEVIEYKDKKRKYRWKNVKEKLNIAIEDDRISEDFVFMNDDFYLLEDHEEIPYYHLGDIKDWLPKNRDGSRYGFRGSRWYKIIREINEIYPDGKFYEVHYPVVFNKKKLKSILENVEDHLLAVTRTHYCNIYKVGGTEVDDFKVYKPENIDEFFERKAFSSSRSVEKTIGFHERMNNSNIGIEEFEKKVVNSLHRYDNGNYTITSYGELSEYELKKVVSLTPVNKRMKRFKVNGKDVRVKNYNLKY